MVDFNNLIIIFIVLTYLFSLVITDCSRFLRRKNHKIIKNTLHMLLIEGYLTKLKIIIHCQYKGPVDKRFEYTSLAKRSNPNRKVSLSR